jgi:hypothetical protein
MVILVPIRTPSSHRRKRPHLNASPGSWYTMSSCKEAKDGQGGRVRAGGVYLKPHLGKTKIGSTDDFMGRYGSNAREGIEVEIPQTRNGPPAGVDDSAYPWTARAQRRFDEEYVDRITPPSVRYRGPNGKSPVSQDKWLKYRHIFGYGDLPADFWLGGD